MVYGWMSEYNYVLQGTTVQIYDDSVSLMLISEAYL